MKYPSEILFQVRDWVDRAEDRFFIYPSDVLYRLAERVDRAEARVLAMLEDRDLRFWEWPRLKEEAQRLEQERANLLHLYAKLYLLHERCTRRGLLPRVVTSSGRSLNAAISRAIEEERERHRDKVG